MFFGEEVATKIETTNQIDISGLANGIYIFKLFTGATVIQKKVIKH
ncbi:MAG: T9SS type A sorting domain-containing protein [Flavobacterium sp.]